MAMAHSLHSSQAPSPLREETTSSQGASRAGRDKDSETKLLPSPPAWLDGGVEEQLPGRLSPLSSAEVCETEDRGTPSKRRREDTTTEHRVTSLASPRGKKLTTVQTLLDNRRSLVARRRASPSKNKVTTKYSEPKRRSERLVGQGSKETLEGPGERRGQVKVVDSSGDSSVARMVGQREDLPGAGKDPQARRSLTFNSQSVWEYPESYWDKIPANSAWRSTVSPTLRETRTTRIQCDERRVGGGLNEDGASPDSVPPISPAENQTGVAVPESQRGSPNLDTSSTSGGPITNSQASEGTGKKAARRTSRKQMVNQPVPTFLQHPVIMTDLCQSTMATLKGLGFRLATTVGHLVGEVLVVRPLNPRKWIIGCKSVVQQNRLTMITDLGGVKVQCTIPVPTTDGVIKGIPTIVMMEELQQSINQGIDSDGQRSGLIKNCSRLKLRNGKPSQAVRVTFQAALLPEIVMINRQEYLVTPYVAPVSRCYRCQRFGHVRADCKSKSDHCQKCGSEKHKEPCIVAKCINCKGVHSAAYQGCPALKERQRANKIRGTADMPFAQAMRRAKQELMEEDERRAMQVPKPTPLQQHDPSWRPEGLLLPIRTDYADAVRHNSIAGNQQPQEGPNRQVHDKATQEKVASSLKKPNEGLEEEEQQQIQRKPRKKRNRTKRAKEQRPVQGNTMEVGNHSPPCQDKEPDDNMQEDDLVKRLLPQLRQSIQGDVTRMSESVFEKRKKIESRLTRLALSKLDAQPAAPIGEDPAAFVTKALTLMANAKAQHDPKLLLDSLLSLGRTVCGKPDFHFKATASHKALCAILSGVPLSEGEEISFTSDINGGPN